MRFDDSLTTVLAADAATSFGAQSAWRQLVDLAGRGRVPDFPAAMARLRHLRGVVPASVRAASARALASAEPPLALIGFFAEDDLAIAAPVLRVAKLAEADWLDLLPRLTPALRSVLRHRRDLSAGVLRALASFGATDFVLGHEGSANASTNVEADTPPPEPAPEQASMQPAPFVAVGQVARALPVVAAALRHAAGPPRFEIADLVARIDAFRRERPDTVARSPGLGAEQWQFETDAAGTIRWVEGVARGPLIGVTLARDVRQGVSQADASIGAVFRAGETFRDLRLEVRGDSSASGVWRLSGVPRFDRATGRYTGLAGTARRPRREQNTGPATSAADALRQLVHELRTPAHAIAGFSELIRTELLGPVPSVYRDRARIIESQAAGLVAAIDDLDTAARLQGEALELRPATLDLAPLLTRATAGLQPIAAERRATLTVDADEPALALADDRAAARLIDRLLAAAVAVAEAGERLHADLAVKTRTVRLYLTRPRALRVGPEDALPGTDREDQGEGVPLLGVGFTLRLVRDLAAALGGSLAITPDRLTLRLPAAVTARMERATAR